MMLLNERNDVSAKDSAVDLSIDRVIRNGRKNTPLCHVDCIGCFIACFDVRLLRLSLFDFNQPHEFYKLLERIFLMALVPFL